MANNAHAPTHDLCPRWARAVQQVACAVKDLESAELDLREAQNALGKDLDPGFQEIDEIMMRVWCTDSGEQFLMSSIKDDENEYRIQVRSAETPRLQPKRKLKVV